MTMTTKNTLAGAVADTEYSALEKSQLAAIALASAEYANDASASSPVIEDYPILPTAKQYRYGMNKRRASINCPVLGLEPEPTIDDYLSDDLRAAKKRKTVAEYLKSKHREALLERMPKFENDTNHALSELQSDVSDLSFRLMLTNWILAAAVIIGVIAWLA